MSISSMLSVSLPKQETMDEVVVEVVRARDKFPRGDHLLAALTEEVGELARALLQDGNGSRVYSEAKQVAAVAIRIMEEGDPMFLNLDPEARKP